MSDKERLENMSPIGVDGEGNVLIKGEDWHWLGEQAERIQEMEEIKRLDEVERVNYFAYQERLYEIDELTEENNRLRKALTFLNRMATSDIKMESSTDPYLVVDVTGDTLEGLE